MSIGFKSPRFKKTENQKSTPQIASSCCELTIHPTLNHLLFSYTSMLKRTRIIIYRPISYVFNHSISHLEISCMQIMQFNKM